MCDYRYSKNRRKNTKNVATECSAVEDDLGNEEEMGEGAGQRGGGFRHLNGKQSYFLYFRLSPLLIRTIVRAPHSQV